MLSYAGLSVNRGVPSSGPSFTAFLSLKLGDGLLKTVSIIISVSSIFGVLHGTPDSGRFPGLCHAYCYHLTTDTAPAPGRWSVKVLNDAE